MSEEQQKIILDVYREHCLEQSKYLTHGGTIQEFINKIKTDNEFSEKWGLKIEERELNSKERVKLFEGKTNVDTSFFPILTDTLILHDIPTKLITLTYNNETIESYE
jgi:hypothetical protein